jgi:hypothetical protein
LFQSADGRFKSGIWEAQPLLLPLANNQGHAFPDEVLRDIQLELSKRFGGLTAYTRAPAKGIWTQKGTLFDRRRLAASS